jgi:hypothetical protein
VDDAQALNARLDGENAGIALGWLTRGQLNFRGARSTIS